MAETATDTRKEIIESARNEFFAHGFDGARMQSIVDNTDVTKAMIHYYFDSKQKLYESVYKESVANMFDGLMDVLNQDIPLFKKLERLIEHCLQIAEQQPEQLAFVITESERKSDLLIPLFRELYPLEISVFDKQLKEAADNYEIASVDVRHVLLNIFSLCFYPVLASKVTKTMLNVDSDEEMSSLAQTRKGVVLDTVLNWLTS